MKKFQTYWIMKDREVSENEYNEMLCCLPPERIARGAFLVGDASGVVRFRYALYVTENGRYYYGGLASVSDFDAFLEPEIK